MLINELLYICKHECVYLELSLLRNCTLAVLTTKSRFNLQIMSMGLEAII